MKKLTLIFCSLLFLSSSSFSQNTNTISIDNDDNFTGFSILDSAINENVDIFVTAAYSKHSESNCKMLFKMFKYLNQKNGVNTITIEQPYSVGYIANKYVQTGDTILLEIIKNNSLTPFFKYLHQLNTSLTPEKKISITGIDYESYYDDYITFYVLNSLLPINKANELINDNILAIKTTAGYLDSMAQRTWSNPRNVPFSISKTKQELINNYNLFRNLYTSFIGKDSSHFIRIMEGLSNGITWSNNAYYRSAQDFVKKTEFQYKVFQLAYKNSTNNKSFTVFDRCRNISYHNKYNCEYSGYNTFIKNLKNDSTLKKQASVMFVYPSSTDRYFKNKTFKESYLNHMDKGDVGLFNNKGKKQYNYYLKDYDYSVIFNNEDVPYLPRKIKWSTHMYMAGDWTGVMLAGGYGIRQFNFGSLNNLLANYPSKPQMQENIPTSSFGLHIIGLMYGSYRINYTNYQNTQLTLNDTATIDIGGRSGSFSIGFDLLPNTFLDITPHIGARYGSLKMDYQYKNTSNNSEEVTSEYSRPFLGLDYNLMVQYRYKGVVGLGVEVGRNVDMITTDWKTKIPNIGNFKQSSTGAYLNLLLTFNLDHGINYYDPSKLDEWRY